MFIAHDLAARIEACEARLSVAVAAAVGAAGVATTVLGCGGGASVLARPGSPINKVIGAGFVAFAAGELDAVEEAWDQHGEPVRAEIATMVPPERFADLAPRGYRLAGFENVLVQRLPDGPQPEPVGEVVVRPAADLPGWAALSVAGFAVPDESSTPLDAITHDALTAVIGDMAAADGFQRFIATIDGRPVGAASVRVDGDIAILCGDATLPPWRRRGVQRALLRARLLAAAAAGARHAVVTTEPGSQSQRNAQARGFALGYSRAVLIRTAT